MLAFLKAKKGYLLHAAALVVIFLAPSVREFASQHAAYSGAILLVEGWLLHWANGRQ
jgi:hypothetical protein